VIAVLSTSHFAPVVILSKHTFAEGLLALKVLLVDFSRRFYL